MLNFNKNNTKIVIKKDNYIFLYKYLKRLPQFKQQNFEFNYILGKYLGLVGKFYGGFEFTWKFVDGDRCLIKNHIFFKLWRKLYKFKYFKPLYQAKSIFYRWYMDLTCFRDPRLLIKVIKYLFINTDLKRHRKLFYCVSNFLKIWYTCLRKTKRIKGYSLFFKGKLAKKGSVRKSIFFQKRGLISFTNKKLKVNMRTYQLWTMTGCIGAGISIFYKVYVYINFFIYS